MSGECRHSGDCARPPSCTGLCPEVVSTLELCSQKSPRRSLRQQQRAKRSVCLAEVKLWRRSMADIHYPFLGGPFHDRPTETAASLRCRKWWRACAWPGCDHKFFERCIPQHRLGALRSGTKRAQGVARSLPTFLAATPTRRGLLSPGSSLASGMGGRRRVEARGAD